MTEQTKKFANYFDEEDEEIMQSPISNIQNDNGSPFHNLNMNEKNKKIINGKNQENILEKKDLIKNEKSLLSKSEQGSPLSSDSGSKNLEYKIPFPKNKSKKENGNNHNSNSTLSNNININNNSKSDTKEKIENKKNAKVDLKKDSAEPVEYYENMEDLMKANTDENMEYDLVGLDELQDYLAGSLEGLDFNYDQMEIEDPEKEIETLEKEYKEDQLNYETLYKLIYLYRDTKKFDKLKELRDHTQKYFPISDDMWKDWIKDELIEINKNHPNEFEYKVKLIDLFERALRDFFYIKISKRFLKYLIFLKKEKDKNHPNYIIDGNYLEYLTVEGIRKKFENILEMWGLDFNLSQKIWDIYLDFEEENYISFINSGNDDEAFKTENIIRSIFRRRLSFPHIDLDIVWKDYAKWEKNEDHMEKIEAKYKESSQKCEEFINLEEKFYELIEVAAKENYAGKLVLFLKVEIPKISKKYYNYAKLYYEKALEFNCDNFEIWKMYIEHTKIHSKDKAWLVSIMLRSCKCCFFCIDLWKILIFEMERNFYSKEYIQNKLREAYGSVEERSEKLDIYMFSIMYSFRSYVPKLNYLPEYNKKQIDFEMDLEGDINLNKKIIYIDPELEAIRIDIKTLLDDLKVNKEIGSIVKLYKIWAEFETYKTQDKKQMEEIMNELVRVESTAETWLSFISYMKYFGDPISIRKTYKRSIEYSKTDKKVLSEYWLEWESM